MTELLVAVIRIDGGTQSRVEIDQDLVNEYAAQMRDFVELPPPVVFFDGSEYWLADGFHRYHAGRSIPLEVMEFDVRTGTRRDAQLYSFGANASHGKRRNNADKRKAVLAMLADTEWSQWSSREIARACSVHHQMVERFRTESSLDDHPVTKPAERTYTTKHGTEATMKTAKIGKKADELKDGLKKPAKKQQPTLAELKAAHEGAGSEADPGNLEQFEIDEDAHAAAVMAEHEVRMSELADAMKAETPLAEVMRLNEDLSKKLAEKEGLILTYEGRVSGLMNELAAVKSDLQKYKKIALRKGA